jgi:glutaryl-CoA dehydrogenase
MPEGEKIGATGPARARLRYPNPGGMRNARQKVRHGIMLSRRKDVASRRAPSPDVAIIWARMAEPQITKTRGFLVEPESPRLPRRTDIHGKCRCALVTSSRPCRRFTSPDIQLLPKTGGLKSPLMVFEPGQRLRPRLGRPSAPPCLCMTVLWQYFALPQTKFHDPSRHRLAPNWCRTN